MLKSTQNIKISKQKDKGSKMNSTYHMLRLHLYRRITNSTKTIVTNMIIKKILVRVKGILCWTFWNQHVFGFGELYDTLKFLENKLGESPKVSSNPLYCTYKKTGVYK